MHGIARNGKTSTTGAIPFRQATYKVYRRQLEPLYLWEAAENPAQPHLLEQQDEIGAN